jgi:hypothetical protein
VSRIRDLEKQDPGMAYYVCRTAAQNGNLERKDLTPLLQEPGMINQHALRMVKYFPPDET